MTSTLELVQTIDVANTLGEGVQWHAESNSLWWTDIIGSILYRFDWSSQTLHQWTTPEPLTAFGIVSANPVTLLVSFASGIARYQPDRNGLNWLARPELHLPGNRFNDGRVDRQGRFWSGTMQSLGDRKPTGTLYRSDEQGCHPVLKNLTIPNTLCWSLDGQRMYHADTPTGRINQYQFDPVSGTPSHAAEFAKVPRGYPDGATIDAEDHLLCALFGGSAVARFSPKGILTTLHELPVSQPTCVALGGPGMNLLFITSATENMTDHQLDVEPLAGSVLVYSTPYRGVAESAPLVSRCPVSADAAR
ncbi:SMP-30/gluconolactonase/LRE family protein [Saccharospirillum impatiens]|uniref:SMP-30/gluconolactonase/LRE family protein n=1 Tax=Saccharospirillum impatiens TaxID=169438 RepID=UPI0003F869EC|nr:SMP-30/gluconolactonase/LRE family protein [Saccharospirillum impatiens]